MAQAILIGARGFDRDEWTGGFYPPELPADWRLAAYANHLRAVLVPGETWETAGPSAIQKWAEDTDPGFRFVLELPPGASDPDRACTKADALEDFFATVAPIHDRIAGLLVSVARTGPVDAGWLDRLLGLLGDRHPLCADLPKLWHNEATGEILARHRCGSCWLADREPRPAPGGRLLIALADTAEPRAMRATIEQLVAWQGEDGVAGLFFEGPHAPENAGKARLVAEMMGA